MRRRKLTALLIAAVMLLTPALALADVDIAIDLGSVTIGADTYSQPNNNINNETYTGTANIISGTILSRTTNTVTIVTASTGDPVDVTIKGVDFSDSSGDAYISIMGDGKAHVELNDVTVKGRNQAIYISRGDGIGTSTSEVELDMKDVEIEASANRAITVNDAKVDINVSGENNVNGVAAHALWIKDGSVTVTGDNAGDELKLSSSDYGGTVAGSGNAMLTVTGSATVTATNIAGAEPVQNVTVVGETQTSTSGSHKTTTITAVPDLAVAARILPDIPTVDELKAMGEEEIEALTEGQMSALTQEHIEALSATQMSWLSSAQIQALRSAQMRWLSATQIAALSDTQLGYLTLDQINALTDEQKALLSDAQLLALETRLSQLTGTASASLKVLCGDPTCYTPGCTGSGDPEHGNLQRSVNNLNLSLSDQGFRQPTGIAAKPGMKLNGLLFIPAVSNNGQVLVGVTDLQAAQAGSALVGSIADLGADDLLITNGNLYVNNGWTYSSTISDGSRLLNSLIGDFSTTRFGYDPFDQVDPTVRAALEGKEFVNLNDIDENDAFWNTGLQRSQSHEQFYTGLLNSKDLIGQDFVLAAGGKLLANINVENVWQDQEIPFFDPAYANCPPNQEPGRGNCPACSGDGINNDSNAPCERCGGTGYSN